MKSFFRQLVVSLMILGLFLPSFAHAQSFTDVAGNHKNFIAIDQLSNQGVIGGYGNGEFHPEGLINRAEMVKLLVLARFGSSAVNVTNPTIDFYDVAATDWYTPYVAAAKEKGIVEGYSDGSFRPSNYVNFAEALKMVLATYGIDTRRMRFQPTDLLFMNANDWFAKYFSYATSKNLINRNKFYHPAQLMTRGEFAEILYRIQEIQAQNLKRFRTIRPVTSDEYRITIPRLGLVDHEIRFSDPYDGQAGLDLLRTVPFGHYLAEPGTGKKFVLYGHSSGYAWDSSPFKVVLREINKLQPGDRIYINYQERGYIYETKDHKIIAATEDYTMMDDQQKNEMLVYTCWPPDSIAQRYVIRAEPVS